MDVISHIKQILSSTFIW